MSRVASRTVEGRIAAAAARQHGVITRAQLLAAGLTPDMVDARVRWGRLRRLHRGVYLHGALVGPLVPARAREMAAVLACGPGALLSHEHGAYVWDLLPPPRKGARVHVTVPGGNRGRRPGIQPHRVASIPPEDVAAVAGIPITSPPRTLLDLAGRVALRELEQAVARAVDLKLMQTAELAELLENRGPRPGAAALRAVIGAGAEPALARSAAEERLLALIRSGGLRSPETNAWIAGHEVDFLWRAEGVVVEVDGFAFHASRRSFEGDRRRDAELAASGIHVVRVTWRQLTGEPDAVLVRLAQMLARSQRG